MFHLGRVSILALALAAIGVTPTRAGLLGSWPGYPLAQSISSSQGFGNVALKCKKNGNCKKFKKKNPQNQNTPGQTQNTPDQTHDQPKPGKNDPKGKKPVVHPFKPVYRPGGICIGGRIVKKRCQCQPGEVKDVIRKNVFSCQPRSTVATAAASQANSAPPAAEFAPDEVLLILPIGNSQQTEEQIATRYNLAILQRADIALLGRRVIRCRISGNRSVGAVLAALQVDAQVDAAQPNYYFRRQATTSGAAASSIQYALEKLQIDAAHAVATGLGVRIAVIDTGVDKSHPDLRAAVADRFDATVGSREVADPHGTAIAGIISAHGAIEGVAPGAKVLDVQVFQVDSSGAGSIATTMSLMRGLQWATEKRARIVNLSLAGARDGLLGQAISAMAAKEIIFVAAAGNAGASAPAAYPAAFADVIAVTATDSADALYTSANHGSYIAVAAPGVDVIAPSHHEAYQMNSGTSFAAAHVSGIIALMIEHEPEVSNGEIRETLQASVKDLGPPGKDDQFGAGRVSALTALQD